MTLSKSSLPRLAHNTRLMGHLDLAGAGQVCVAGRYAYVGHIPNKANLGTTNVDIAARGTRWTTMSSPAIPPPSLTRSSWCARTSVKPSLTIPGDE